MTFFEKVTVLRKRAGLSARRLAYALTIDPSAISRWRSRGNMPREAIIVHLASYFGVTAEALTNDEIELPKETTKPFRSLAVVRESAGSYETVPPRQKVEQVLQHIRRLQREIDGLRGEVENLLNP